MQIQAYQQANALLSNPQKLSKQIQFADNVKANLYAIEFHENQYHLWHKFHFICCILIDISRSNGLTYFKKKKKKYKF